MGMKLVDLEAFFVLCGVFCCDVGDGFGEVNCIKLVGAKVEKRGDMVVWMDVLRMLLGRKMDVHVEEGGDGWGMVK